MTLSFFVTITASRAQALSTDAQKAEAEKPVADTSQTQMIDKPSTAHDLQPNQDDFEDDGSAAEATEVTSVSQLSDVQPSDWAYQALKNIVERYGIIAGYPDGTFQGNRPLSRYEFATALNVTLKKLEELIASSSTTNKVTQQDLETIGKLQTDFAAELSSLELRLNRLDNRNAFLKNHQFSPTSVIGGEAIFGLSDAFGGNPPGTGKANEVLHYLTRVQLVSSFTGKDRLRLELAAGNFSNLGFANNNVLKTYNSLLSYQADTQNNILLSALEYRFITFSDRVVFIIKPVGFTLSNILSPNFPYIDEGGGAVSRFGSENPVFRIGALDAGLGADWLLSNRVRLQLAYGVANPNEPTKGFLFGADDYATGAQLLFLPSDNVLTGISYLYGYLPDGALNTFTGSLAADTSDALGSPSHFQALSASLRWRISPKFTLATWGGITRTDADARNAFAVTTNYMLSLGLSDPFGHQGDLLALFFGQPPRLTQASVGLLPPGNADSFHIEALYRYNVNDRISVTAGLFVVTHPENVANNNTVYISTLRTTFRF